MGTALIAEDDSQIRDLVSRWLEGSGWRVVAVDDGHDAIQLLAETPVDLVVADLFLKGDCGLGLLRRVNPHLTGMPVIILGQGGDGSALDYGRIATLLGAAGVLTRPFDRNEFLHTLAAALEPRTPGGQP
ncbi:response regulator [Rhodospirillum centenum]|uniref:Response regulator receiver domain proteni n=1 Tax=Rhodospirillum centenum (strain ATCC 51521 / SW) TaxID=414684 RepID=B6IYM1_RHOCS|nr:response regulator [Rhodospirillum centenum]ACJ01395.1 Response regulator receiver domain proteni [Rhodospirillum centenum SW]